jgi:SAM-dependent methyltransferase
MSETGNIYILGETADDTELIRLRKLQGYCDPITTRHLERLGVGEGWRCLEVGAGAGSIARWLAGRVGPSGSVLATDLDPRFLTDVPANVEVRRHDIDRDDLETGFDLAHCRTLLMHLPDPVATLSRMVQALRPGGWLLAEDFDFGLLTFSGHPEAAWVTAAWHAFFIRLQQAGLMDAFIGRRLPALAAAAGIDGLGAEAFSSFARKGADLQWDVLQDTVPALRPAALATGTPESEYDRLAAIVADPSLVWFGINVVSVWGRRPD